MTSRDLIKQHMIDCTQSIYPPRSEHWLARIARAIARWL